MALLNWNDRVLQLLSEIRNNGTPQGSAEGLNLRVLDVNVSDENPVPISDGGGSITVDGAVLIANLPATQQVGGSVNVGNFPATQQVSGSVNVGNFPATQQVNGTVNVGNFPATQEVEGIVTVSNLPASRYATYEEYGVLPADVVKVLPGTLFSLCVHNFSTDRTRYFQLFDRATVPTTGQEALIYFPVCSGNSWVLDSSFFGLLGRTFTTGIAWAWSNTPKDFSPVQSPSEHSTFINYL